MTIKVCIYDKEAGLSTHESLDPAREAPESAMLWVDVETRDPEELGTVAKLFKLHELTVEDCLDRGHSPKLEDFGSYVFMIFRGLKPLQLISEDENELDLEPTDEDDEEPYTRAVSIYLGERYVITHRNDEVPWLDALLRQVTQIPERTLARGTDMLAHRIIDVLIDRFTRGLGAFEDVIDRLEGVAIQAPEDFELSDVLELKRGLGALRQVMRDHKVGISRLAHDRALIGEQKVRRYFRDVDDHATAAIKQIDKQIEMLVGIRDVYFAMANVRLGDIMRILAVITTIAVPLNIVVGLYGMNFAAIPLLDSPYGFWLVIAIMSILTCAMLLFFRRNRWI